MPLRRTAGGSRAKTTTVTATGAAPAVTLDWSLSSFYIINCGTATGVLTITNLNLRAGDFFAVEIIQGSGPITSVVVTGAKWVQGQSPIISVANGAIDLASGPSPDGTSVLWAYNQAFS